MSRIQQSVSNFTANAQTGPWLLHDFYEAPFDLTLGVSFGPTSSYTLGIDYALGDPGTYRQVFLTQATTTITIVDGGPGLIAATGQGLGHCLAVGDLVFLQGTPNVDGIYPVASVVNATSYTLTSVTSQTIAGIQANVWAAFVFPAGATDKIIPIAAGTTRYAVGVLSPIIASRLHVTAFTTGGTSALIAVQGGTPS